MTHYVHCPFWLFLLVKALPVPPSSLPLTRLGLVDPGIHTLRAVSISFAGYHAVKRLANKLGSARTLSTSTKCTWCMHVFWMHFVLKPMIWACAAIHSLEFSNNYNCGSFGLGCVKKN